jgi:hypothetical protein
MPILRIDRCKLTGRPGKHVKSHLIPKALTRPQFPGLPMYQVADGAFAKKTFDTWYDKSLVTREGEDILASYDDWAISALRDGKLVWSGWGDATTLTPDQCPLPDEPLMGVRKVTISDPTRLRLFFLSLLWRAAASQLPAFRLFTVPDARVDELARMLVDGVPGPDWYCPITLVQHSTRGEVHCLTPIEINKNYGGYNGQPDVIIPCYRFYFDGLMAHIHASFSPDGGLAAGLGDLIVGHSSSLTVTMLPYENSFEQQYFDNLRNNTVFDQARLRQRQFTAQ